MLQYRGLKGALEHITIDEAEVDRQINRLLESRPRTVPVEGRAAQLGDEVVIDFAGEMDGEKFEGGSAENYPLVLGSGTFIHGFEEQLVGRRAGEDAVVSVVFPDGYPVASLAGRKAAFHCHVREIRRREKYLADDEFARAVGGVNSMAEMREKIRREMQAAADRHAERELKLRLLDQLVEQAQPKVTEEQLEKALDIEMRDLEAQLAAQHLTLEQYAQFTGRTRAQLREDSAPDARRNAERQLVIGEIARREGIAADEETMAQAIFELCRDHNLTLEEFQPYLNSETEAAIARSAIEERVLNLLRDSAEITVTEIRG